MANEKKGAIERFAESAFMKKLQVGSQKLASNEIFSTISGGMGATMGLIMIGAVMGFYFVMVLRPLFVLDPAYTLPLSALVPVLLLVLGATLVCSAIASRLVNRLEPTELLRDE